MIYQIWEGNSEAYENWDISHGYVTNEEDAKIIVGVQNALRDKFVASEFGERYSELEDALDALISRNIEFNPEVYARHDDKVEALRLAYGYRSSYESEFNNWYYTEIPAWDAKQLQRGIQ